jgi:hypothetical protein
MLENVRLRQLFPCVRRFGEGAASDRTGVGGGGQISATLRRAESDTAANRAHKIGIKILTTRLGEGVGTAFAVCVLLGALWLLVSSHA